MSGGGNQTSTTNPPQFAMGPFEQWLGHFEQQALPGGQWSVDKYGNQLYTPPLNGPLAPSPYPNQQVAPFSPLQTEALGAIEQLGPYSPVAGAASQQEIDTLSGKYLSDPNRPFAPNPELQAYADAASKGLIQNYQQAIAPGITAQAVREGALGGSGQNQAEQYAKWGLGENLGDLQAKIYEPAYEAQMNRQVQQYENERQRQMGAVGQAPATTAGMYAPAQALLGAGNLEQTQQQNILNTAAQNYQQQSMWPYQLLSNFGNALGGITGGRQTINAGGGGFK